MKDGTSSRSKGVAGALHGPGRRGPVTPNESARMGVEPPAMPGGVDVKDYWVLQVRGTAWYMVMVQIAKTVDTEKHITEQPAIALMQADGTPFYLFKKKFYPVEVMMEKLGLTQEYLESHPVVSLRETKK